MQIVNDLKKLPQFGTKTKRFMMCLWMMVMDQNKVGYWGNRGWPKTLVGFKYATSAQMGRVFASMNSSGSGIYDVDGMSYTVSEYVENEVSRNKGFAYSEFKGALIHHGLKLAGFSGKKVSLSTTLPIGYYYKDGVADIEYISKVRDALQKPFTSADGADLASIVPNMHTIQPESVCVF
ncbi:plasmid segregation protein ParM [Paraglaciecola sp. Hal342]